MSAQVQTSKAARVPPKTVEIQIKRRANPDAPQYWERFEIPYRPNLNIISCLITNGTVKGTYTFTAPGGYKVTMSNLPIPRVKRRFSLRWVIMSSTP